MQTLFFVSHTHWDREWYEPFQVFRTRLVHCIDKLLDILAADPDYKHFMLDGQTIVLEDYLQVRPDQEHRLRELVNSGRLAIGPWYVLPDEFLVSGEAIIRNLQRGMRIANEFGETATHRDSDHARQITPEGDAGRYGAMRIGYLPDPFGHISQMPQILRGFGLGAAAFRRGLADEPTEIWWEAPDGTRVLACYLRDGYDNAAWMQHSEEGFVDGIRKIRDSLTPHAPTSNILLMNGTDHMEPWSDLPRLLDTARARIADIQIIHASLPMYVQAVESEIIHDKLDLGLVRGELRNPKRLHLLPGVASTRVWIKQRNAHAQTLLEKWAEPFAAFAALEAEGGKGTNAIPAHQSPLSRIQLLSLAWKYLLENHPHDSICGCGIDQTHEEMRTRFDWSEQIAEQIVNASLGELAASINTLNSTQAPAIIVFNPAAGPRTDAVIATCELPGRMEEFQIVTETGDTVPFQILNRRVDEYYRATVNGNSLGTLLSMGQQGRVLDMTVQDAFIRADETPMRIDVTLTAQGEPNPQILQEGLPQIRNLIQQNVGAIFDVRAHSPTKLKIEFVAQDVPGKGYQTFYIMRAKTGRAKEAPNASSVLENEFFRVEPIRENGTCTITDKSTGAVYRGVNHFVDGGDRGDLYNYNPPEDNTVIAMPSAAASLEIERGPARQSLRLKMIYRVPAQLSDDRSARAGEMVDEHITTTLSLFPGVRRIDFHTEVENRARDHRLRVEFPAPIVTAYANAEQAFDTVTRSLDLPRDTAKWIEQPRPEAPMQSFASINDEQIGLTLAARGLPEYEAYINPPQIGEPGRPGETVLALTLLRCTGWLSRNDLTMRSGHAGPALETPGAQEIGHHIFEYALIPHPGNWRSAQAEAHSFAAPLRTVTCDAHSGALPPEASFVNVVPREFVLTAIKLAEDGKSLLVRGYNCSEEPLQVTLHLWREFGRAARVGLNEEELAVVELQEGRQVKLSVRPKEILTIRFEPAD
jgi:mannosylglycerate hydrolase